MCFCSWEEQVLLSYSRRLDVGYQRSSKCNSCDSSSNKTVDVELPLTSMNRSSIGNVYITEDASEKCKPKVMIVLKIEFMLNKRKKKDPQKSFSLWHFLMPLHSKLKTETNFFIFFFFYHKISIYFFSIHFIVLSFSTLFSILLIKHSIER